MPAPGSCSGRGREYVLFWEKTREGPSGPYHPLGALEDASQFQREGEVPTPTPTLHQKTHHRRGRR